MQKTKNGGEKPAEGDQAETSSSHVYKRYKLSDDKTFDTLFFKEKENLLRLVSHFTAKTGKYAIRGFPHKLGLLLHGPPGTGKVGNHPFLFFS
jgi:chaperone BCS1